MPKTLGLGLIIALLVANSAFLGCERESSGPTVLTWVEVIEDQVDAEGLSDPATLAMSGDGRHLYVAGASFNEIAVFSRDTVTGSLSFVENHRDRLGGTNEYGFDRFLGLALSGDGKHLYAARFDEDSVALFSRNAISGRLTFVEAWNDGTGGVEGIDGANALVIAPNDKHLYVAGLFENALAVFERDATTGALTFLEVHRDSAGGVDGLDFPNSVAISPDGRSVYVGGTRDEAVAVFSRDTTTGSLRFVEAIHDSALRGNALFGVESLTVSPDGAHLYVGGGAYGKAVTVLSRNQATGELTFAQSFEATSDGIAGIRSVIVSPDGNRAYALATRGDAVMVFDRDPATGDLTLIELQQDGKRGVEGLSAPISLLLSPDGRHLYMGSFRSDSVALFSVGASAEAPVR